MPLQIYPVRMPAELLKQSRKAAIDAGLPLAEIIRRLLMMWITGKVKIK
jgi:hypothetical protein